MDTDRPARYDDPCGIARALNAVGERWALLVIRELAFSAKRFGDLRRGLGSISPNVLTQRLGEMVGDGIVLRRTMGPPIGASVYELTESGRAVIPVLDALATWGSRRPIRSSRELSRDALMFAMQTTVRSDGATLAPITVVLDGVGWSAEVDRGALTWHDIVLTTEQPTLTTSAKKLRALVFGDRDLGRALANGHAEVTGDIDRVRAFLGAFERPPVTMR